MLIRREHRQRLLAMNLEAAFLQSESSQNEENESTMGLF
jgi:hypothetical protein